MATRSAFRLGMGGAGEHHRRVGSASEVGGGAPLRRGAGLGTVGFVVEDEDLPVSGPRPDRGEGRGVGKPLVVDDDLVAVREPVGADADGRDVPVGEAGVGFFLPRLEAPSGATTIMPCTCSAARMAAQTA